METIFKYINVLKKYWQLICIWRKNNAEQWTQRSLIGTWTLALPRQEGQDDDDDDDDIINHNL
jgi:hypothetical protein